MMATRWGEQHSYKEEKLEVGWAECPGPGDRSLPTPPTPSDFQERSKSGLQQQRVEEEEEVGNGT